MTGKLEHRLFVGSLLSSDIKLCLQKSSSWKQARIGESPLKEIHHLNKEYIGLFIDKSQSSLKEVKEKEEFILQTLQSHCSDLDPKVFKVVIFPQILIT